MELLWIVPVGIIGIVLALAAFMLPISVMLQLSAALSFRLTRSDERYVTTGAIFVLINAIAAFGCVGLTDPFGFREPFESWPVWAFWYFAVLAVVPTIGIAIYLAVTVIGFLFGTLINAIRGEPVPRG